MRISGDLKPLVEAIEKNGYTIVPDGRAKHAKIVYGKEHPKRGQRVQDENGPLIIAGTSSEFRDRDQTATRWIRAGILKPDQVPWRNAKPGRNGSRKQGRNRIADPDVQAAKVAAIHAKSERMHERTGKLRARLEPIIVKIGGWRYKAGREGVGVSVTELAAVAEHFAKTRGRQELPKGVSENALRASAQSLKKPGDTLGEKWLPFWELFVDELERGGDPLGRWMELYREWKGIPKEVTTPAPGEPVELAKANGKADLGPKTFPKIALQAVAWMAKSADGEEQMQEVIGIGQSILQLEMER